MDVGYAAKVRAVDVAILPVVALHTAADFDCTGNWAALVQDRDAVGEGRNARPDVRVANCWREAADSSLFPWFCAGLCLNPSTMHSVCGCQRLWPLTFNKDGLRAYGIFGERRQQRSGLRGVSESPGATAARW